MWTPDSLYNTITFISGSGKNAGKTTFLNYAANSLRKNTPVGIVSIGVDGEARDLVFGNPKPRIPVAKGDVVVTTAGAVNASDANFTILNSYPQRTVLGRLVAARAERNGYVEIIGPETNSQLTAIVEDLQRFVATILVDGAANRITQISQSPCGFVEVLWVTPATATRMLERLRFLAWATAPERHSVPSTEPIVVTGALTPSRLQDIATEKRPILLEDFTRIFVSLRELNNLSVHFQHHYPLRGVVVNGFDCDIATWLLPHAQLVAALPLVENPYRAMGEQR